MDKNNLRFKLEGTSPQRKIGRPFDRNNTQQVISVITWLVGYI